MSKAEFASLLPPGLHALDIEELREACVAQFHLSVRRPALFVGFETFVNDLRLVVSKGQIWVDGSFLTEKTEPDDIDIALILDADEVNALGPSERGFLQMIAHRPTAKAKYHCDAYIVNSSDHQWLSYWRGWFGFFRDGKTAKGMAVVEIGT